MIKIVQLLGSALFLTGACLYITGYDNMGAGVYVACAICYVTASIMDIAEYKCLKTPERPNLESRLDELNADAEVESK